MSAMRTDTVDDLAYHMNKLAEYFMKNPKYYEILNSIYKDIERFGAGNILDIYDFCTVLNNSIQDYNLSLLLNNVKNSFSASVMANCHGSYHPNAHGLTIYVPNNVFDALHLILYRSHSLNLDFAQHTLWDEMLKEYILNKIGLGF